jgi:hypothetical protein
MRSLVPRLVRRTTRRCLARRRDLAPPGPLLTAGRLLATRCPRPVRALLLLTLVLSPPLVSPAAGAGEVRPASGVWPLTPRPTVVAGFRPPATRWGRGHRGVDLAGSPAQVVRSALPGRVLFAGRIAGRGVVVIGHGAERTTYEPVSATVHVGDSVAGGLIIGHLELFGSHCFPGWCLHWGYIEGHDHYLDPLVLVGAAPVVLLPLWGPLGPGGAPGVTGVHETGAGRRSTAGTHRPGTRPGPSLPVPSGLGVVRLGPAPRAALLLGLPGGG